MGCRIEMLLALGGSPQQMTTWLPVVTIRSTCVISNIERE
jgi:hypothetical protein